MPSSSIDCAIIACAQMTLAAAEGLSQAEALAVMVRCAERVEVHLVAVAVLVYATGSLPAERDTRVDVPSAAVSAFVVSRGLDAAARMARAQGTLMERNHSTALEALHDIHACADELGIGAFTVADVLVHTATPSVRVNPV